MNSIPVNHLAIIPDGNRRWAKLHDTINEKQLYELGSDVIFGIVNAAFEADVQYITIWASSYANLLARPKPFVTAIEAVFVQKFHELATHPLIHEKHVKVEVVGEWRSLLKPKTVAAIEESMRATAHYSDRYLTLLVGYDGQRERGEAVYELLQSHTSLSRDEAHNAGDQLLRNESWTGHLPDVDLIIRTGSWTDPHNSAGFLSLLTGDSQYSFPEVLWPDFNPDMLRTILNDFSERERRLGR